MNKSDYKNYKQAISTLNTLMSTFASSVRSREYIEINDYDKTFQTIVFVTSCTSQDNDVTLEGSTLTIINDERSSLSYKSNAVNRNIFTNGTFATEDDLIINQSSNNDWNNIIDNILTELQKS